MRNGLTTATERISKKTIRWLIIAVCICLVGMLDASLVQSDFGIAAVFNTLFSMAAVFAMTGITIFLGLFGMSINEALDLFIQRPVKSQ